MASVAEMEQRVQDLERNLAEEREKNEALKQKISELQCASEAERASSGTQNSDLPAELQQLSLEKVRLAAERAENAFEAEQEYIMHKLRKQMAVLEHDKKQLSLERQQLKRKVQSLQSSVERLTQEKVDLEASLELEEEAFINNLVRQLSGFMQNYQAMDRAMHEHGIRITPMPVPLTPTRAHLARASTVSQEGASQETLSASVSDASPHAPARQAATATAAPGVSTMPAGRRPAAAARAGTGMARSLGGSPGATLHATRERLEALARAQDDRRRRRPRRRPPRDDERGQPVEHGFDHVCDVAGPLDLARQRHERARPRRLVPHLAGLRWPALPQVIEHPSIRRPQRRGGSTLGMYV